MTKKKEFVMCRDTYASYNGDKGWWMVLQNDDGFDSRYPRPVLHLLTRAEARTASFLLNSYEKVSRDRFNKRKAGKK